MCLWVEGGMDWGSITRHCFVKPCVHRTYLLFFTTKSTHSGILLSNLLRKPGPWHSSIELQAKERKSPPFSRLARQLLRMSRPSASRSAGTPVNTRRRTMLWCVAAAAKATRPPKEKPARSNGCARPSASQTLCMDMCGVLVGENNEGRTECEVSFSMLDC